MIAWGKFPFVRFTSALLLGILFYIYSGNPFNLFFYLLPVIAVVYVIVALRKADNLIAGILAVCCTFCFGVLLANLNDASFYQDNIKYKKFSAYEGEVVSDVEDRGSFYRAEVSVVKIKTEAGWERSSGNVMVYIRKDTTSKPIVYGNRLLIKTSPQEVKAPLNPGEFDYKKYLTFQNIYHQQFLGSRQFQLLPEQGGNFFISKAYYLRHYCDHVLKASITGKAYPIASALVLGIRNSLDDELKTAYSSTGTIHVLAVSGLHIVIIYGLLFFVFGFVKNVRGGDVLFTCIIFVLLWLYAFVTGFSASVVRAVTMFSFVLLAQLINRKSNIYNTLALSAFIMLCFNPFLVMDAGFQLSYLAVLGIVLLYEPIYGLIEFKNKVADKIWAMAVVSIVAQLATAPITMYYFNQFSFSFLLANFIAIPLSSLALFTSLAVIALNWISPVALFVGKITELVITIMNQSIVLLNKVPYLAVKAINISPEYVLLLYLLIAFALLFFTYKKFNYFLLTSLIIITLAGINVVMLWNTAHRKQLIVFNIKNRAAVTLIKADQAELFADSSLLKDKKKLNQLTTLLTKMDVSTIQYKEGGNKLVYWEGKTIYIGKSEADIDKADFCIVKASIVIDNKTTYNTSTQGAYITDL